MRHQLLLREATPRPRRRLIASDGTEYLDFTTIDYLGLAFDPRCMEAHGRATAESGLHLYCSPIYLRPPSQAKLEGALAELTGFTAAALFSSATSLHLGVLPLLVSRHQAVFVDEFAHQSIHDSLRLVSGERVTRFRHCSPDDVDAVRRNG